MVSRAVISTATAISDIARGSTSFASADQQDIHVLRGDGMGGFTITTTALPANLFLLNLRPGDVTGDGEIDLVATAYAQRYRSSS